MVEENIQNNVPILAIRTAVLFPTMVMPVTAGRDRSIAAVEAALEKDRTIALFTQRDNTVEEPGADDLYTVGTLARILKVSKTGDTYHLVLQGTERVRLVRLESTTPGMSGRIQPLPLIPSEGAEVEALHRTILELSTRLLALIGQTSAQGAAAAVKQFSQQMSDPMQLVYFLAGTISLETDKEQAVLEAGSRLEALELTYKFLLHEIEVQEVKQSITDRTKNEVGKEQREYLLRQQLRAIQQELGEDGDGASELELLREKIEQADLPEEVRKEAERELKKLGKLNQASPDHALTRTYLELIAELPWKATTEDNHDLKRARAILDEDHFGLKDIKERILEHLAVMKLNPNAKAPILLFVGPPGVGKTSLGQSIARALERKFERMSLGGLHDEAELRGHRRTYVGALPGRLIQAVRRAGVKNPVLMLDEADKIGMSYRGDPAAALLEIIDPAQNDKFRDNYLDLPFDLSKTMFILTANTTESIPRPLLDRMEVIRLTGYSEEEKLQIARRYLLPRQLSETGVDPSLLELPDETLSYLITHYTREAGVRELERTLGKVTRKLALRFAESEGTAVRLTVDDVGELLGPERHLPELGRGELVVGVATGLAWTEAGGDVLYIESLLLPGKKDLTLTGQLGDVMKESAQAARSYILSQAERFSIPERLVRDAGIHVHVPAGAIPKDGPSAGITMAVSLASAYTRTPVRKDLAMTGEVTLTGLVLPVGGIKEKVLAARRAGIKKVILPRANRKDLRELPDNVREEMEFVLADTLDDVLREALPTLKARPPKIIAA